MSGKNKNYNSIIFLTTLSVYLGLVLVSGAPQVFAYAATTRNFDIQHEIEFKDDLDNKPDNESFSELKTKVDGQDHQVIAEYIHFLSAGLKKYHPSEIGRYNDQFHLVGADEGIAAYLKESLSALHDFKADKHIPLSKFTVKFADEKVNSPQTFSTSPAILQLERQSPKVKAEKTAAENTKVTFENSQIFIMTNFPRAGIDSPGK